MSVMNKSVWIFCHQKTSAGWVWTTCDLQFISKTVQWNVQRRVIEIEKKKKKKWFPQYQCLHYNNAKDIFMLLTNVENDVDAHKMSSLHGTIHECTSDKSAVAVHIAPFPGHRNCQRSFLSRGHRGSHQRVGQTRYASKNVFVSCSKLTLLQSECRVKTKISLATAMFRIFSN